VYELLILILMALAFGTLRPRWSSLAVAVGVGAAVAAWSYTLEEIPGEPKGIDDVAWSVGFGAGAAVAVAFVCGVGVLLGRKLRSRRSLLR
jgi:drug/metabolite transporter (DMT)-like permease